MKPFLRVEQIGPLDSRRTVWRLVERKPATTVWMATKIEWPTPLLFTDIISATRWISVRPEQEMRYRHIQEIVDHTRLLDNILVTVLLPQVQKEVDSWLGTDTLLSSEHGC